MSIRTVEAIIAPREAHFVGDGFRVHNFIPSNERLSMQRMNPFIMLDYGSKYNFAPSEIPKGVGVHPHRGFETVTIAYKGRIEHHDSSGGGGIIGEGDVQWMTAAAGVLHKEFHEREWSKKGGEMQMVQLWVNLPARYKMTAPKYQALKNADIKRYVSDEGNVEIEIIAGEYRGIKGSATTFSPVNVMNARLQAGAEAEFSFPALYNTALLVIDGEVSVNNSESITENYFTLMAKDGEQFTLKAAKNSTVLILSAEPIHEAIAAHGPFVMNTRQELIEAFEDFNNGKFGFLEDEA